MHRFKLLSCKELKIIEHNALVTIIPVKKRKKNNLLIIHIEYVNSVLQLWSFWNWYQLSSNSLKKQILYIPTQARHVSLAFCPLGSKHMKPRPISYAELNESKDKINQHYNIWMCMKMSEELIGYYLPCSLILCKPGSSQWMKKVRIYDIRMEVTAPLG